MSAIRILFAGGGTGGHLFPGLAIAHEIERRKPDAEILFVGTKDRLEARVVPQHGFAFQSIWISGLRRRWTFDNLLFPLKVLVGCMQSFFVIKKFKPDVVVGTGGYACGPPLFVASVLGIPSVIQEQNSFPGITTRMLSKRATQVHLAFESSKEFLKRQDNLFVSGNPTALSEHITREQGLHFFHLAPGKKTLLVFGGSLGATSINKATEKILPALCEMGLHVIWQTGERDYEDMRQAVEKMKAAPGTVLVFRFIEQMQYAYAACDLAVCRSGATTLAELTSRGVPAVLSPYPFATADHQRKNAEVLVRNGAAVMLADQDLNDHLLRTVQELLEDDARRDEMAKNAKSLGKPEAAATVASAVLTLAER